MGPSAKKLSVPGTEKNLSGHDWSSPPTGPQDKPSQRETAASESGKG